MKLLKSNINLISKNIPSKLVGIIILFAMLLTYLTVDNSILSNSSQNMAANQTLFLALSNIGVKIWPKVLPQILQCKQEASEDNEATVDTVDKEDNQSDSHLASNNSNKSCNSTIINFVKKGESLYDIFKKNNIDMDKFARISKTIKCVFNPKDIKPNMSYRIVLDRSTDDIVQLRYSINSSTFLEVNNNNGRYKAKKIDVPLEMKYGVISGSINNSLLGSIGKNKMSYTVLYDLSDIFKWDIDFTTDIKKGDSYKIIVEEFYSNGIFKKYGRIMYAEFKNDGVTHEAFWYKKGNIHGYFNALGRSFQTALTRAPLQFRYISSYFSYNRLHPILKIRRPHLGVDYAAAAGTPVSAAGDGVIVASGYNSQIGNHVRIEHPGGYRTNYGHLQGFAKGIHAGIKVKQGKIIGYVGSTGLATGPHLDYRVQVNNVPINPLSMKLPTLQSIPPRLMNNFILASAKMKRDMAVLYADNNGYKNLKKTAHF